MSTDWKCFQEKERYFSLVLEEKYYKKSQNYENVQKELYGIQETKSHLEL